MGVTHMGVAIVIEGDRVLIGIRPPGVPLAGLAEFPGGKCELEETAVDCAVRECRRNRRCGCSGRQGGL